jgi:hypothetical protein
LVSLTPVIQVYLAMKKLMVLQAHLLTTVQERPPLGGAEAVVADSLLLDSGFWLSPGLGVAGLIPLPSPKHAWFLLAFSRSTPDLARCRQPAAA